MQKIKFIWNKIENLLFIGFAASILYLTINSFIDGSLKSFIGMGYLNDMADPIQKKDILSVGYGASFHAYHLFLTC